MRSKSILAGAALALLVSGPAAFASTVTKYVEFSATGFTSFDGTTHQPTSGGPTVSGSFTITFDPTLLVENATTGITLDSLDIALGSALSYSYDPTSDLLNVGGIASNTPAPNVINTQVVQYAPATDDFWLHIDNFLSGATFEQVGFAQTSIANTLYYTDATNGGSGSVTVSAVAAPVPLPASASLLILAFLGLGVMHRRRVG